MPHWHHLIMYGFIIIGHRYVRASSCLVMKFLCTALVKCRPSIVDGSIQIIGFRVPQRNEFRLAVLTYRCLNGTAPRYLADGLRRVADISSRSRLRSASTALLEVPRSKHSTIGDRALPVAAAKVWNGLPPSITSSPSLPQFLRALKKNCSDDRTATHVTKRHEWTPLLTWHRPCSLSGRR